MRARVGESASDGDENDAGAGAEDGGVDPVRAARAAASAAAVGAAVGAVRALTERRAADDEEAEEVPAQPETEPETEPEPEPEGQAEPEPEPEPEPRRRSRRDSQPREGIAASQVEGAIQSAREQLRQLFGAEPESVSSFGRTRDGWRVTLEVVEVRRIPETTDVLASYEVELDGGGDLIAFERVRRYQRSETLDGSGP